MKTKKYFLVFIILLFVNLISASSFGYNMIEEDYEVTVGISSANLWDALDTPADILGSLINNNLGWVNTSGNSSFNESYTDGKYAKYNFTTNNFNGSGNITTTGRIGIGGETPTSHLEIRDDSGVTTPTFTFYDDDIGLALDQPLGSIEWYQTDASGNGPGVRAQIQLVSDSIGYLPDLVFKFDGVEKFRFGTQGDFKLIDDPNNPPSFYGQQLTTDIYMNSENANPVVSIRNRDNYQNNYGNGLYVQAGADSVNSYIVKFSTGITTNTPVDRYIINGVGNSYFSDKILIGNITEWNITAPTSALEVQGDINISKGNDLFVSDDLFVGDDVDITGETTVTNITVSELFILEPITLPVCTTAVNGTIARNSTKLYFCDGVIWNDLY